jgi:hypothetical protein
VPLASLRQAAPSWWLRFTAGDTAVMCLDIEDNANDDVYVFSVVDAGATLNVEQLGQLQQINQSGAVVIDAGPSFFPPRDVADGFCGF